MSLPTPAQLGTLQYGWQGAPSVIVQMSSVDTRTLAWAWQAQPVVGVTSSAPPSIAARPVVFVVT